MGAQQGTDGGWGALLQPQGLPALAVLLGGVLLHSMNVLLLATVLPTIVGELGGAALMSWPTTAFLASSIVAATCTGLLTASIGARAAFCTGAFVFGVGATLCSLAPDMGWVVAGRFVQGFGGGVLTAVAYIVVRSTFPEAAWARAIALLSGMWSVSIVVGPLAGGAFARYGDWRGVFVAVSAIAFVLAVGAWWALPATASAPRKVPKVPGLRVALICAAIAGTSSAAVVASPLAKAGLIALSVVTLALMIRIDRRAKAPLLPGDAFSFATQTGLGLWLVLLLCVAYSPVQIFVPIFLQRLHGFDPLAAGYAVAGASFGWTSAALLVAGAAGAWPGRLMLAGPATMAVGLAALALLAPSAPWPMLPAIVVLGAGIGVCWAFVAQRVMGGARRGEEAIAASSVPTVQQMGFALGAALAGLTANTSGFSTGSASGVAAAAFWVPASFVAPALLALVIALRLRARSTGRA
ncbi:MAG: MFS transporter [Alphaproteobacteria bacterium]|nr:MFS transporter [Alphaproteobacteria bacterium]